MEQEEKLTQARKNQPALKGGKNPWKPIIAYVAIGYAWILFSDSLLGLIVRDPSQYMAFQSYKGIVYVLVTAVVLFMIIRSDYDRIFELSRTVVTKNEALLAHSISLEVAKRELDDQVALLNDTMADLLEQKKYSQAIFHNSTAAIIIWSLDGQVIDVNNYFQEVFGLEAAQLLGDSCYRYLNLETTSQSVADFLGEVARKGHQENVRVTMKDRSGADVHMMWNCALVYNPHAQADTVVCFGIDTTGENIREDMITELAYHDSLTGLANLSVYKNEVEDLIGAQLPFEMFFLDFDNFRNLNDIRGHGTGNRFLANFASALAIMLPDCRIYRWGGDEFMIIDVNPQTKSRQILAGKLLELARQDFVDVNFTYHPSASIGMVGYPEHGETSEELIKNIDLALHQAKLQGKNRALVFQCAFQDEIERRLEIENGIRRMLQENRFVLNFQPIFATNATTMSGVEVLLRWHDEKLDCATGTLIKVAEQSGQIIAIDRLVIEQTFAIVAKNLCNSPLLVSINLSAHSVATGDLPEFLTDCLERYNLDPARFEFELTEHSLVEDLDHTKNLIATLKGMGFSISLDDFGTVYSSFNYLVNLPFDRLKIDKTYIDLITKRDNEKVVVSHLISLARSLGIATVAEGVETAAQLDLLQNLGCDYIQGYYRSRELAPVDLIALL